jgi:phage shock protein A
MGLFRRDSDRPPHRGGRGHDARQGLGRLEDPGAAFDLAHERQLRALQQLRASTAQLIASAKRLEVQSLQLKARRTRLDEQARRAVAAGREPEAVDALTHAQELATQAEELDARVAQLAELRGRLDASGRVLESRVISMGAEAETMRAQYGAAQAAAAAGEAVAGLGAGDSDLDQLVRQARDKIEWTQARADALGELLDSGALPPAGSRGGQGLSRQLEAGAASEQVQARLRALKAELGPGGDDPEALGAGHPAAT